MRLNIFLRELKEPNFIEVDWIKGEENTAGVLSKNNNEKIFDKFLSNFCGYDIYMKQIGIKYFQMGRVFDMFDNSAVF